MNLESMKKYWLLVAVALVLPLVFSCGGGGSSGGTTNTPATIDSACAEQATAMAMAAGDLQDIGLGVGGVFAYNSMSMAPQNSMAFHDLGLTMLDRVKGKILSQKGLEAPLGSESGTFPCATSGNYSGSVTWDGPDYPTDICQVSNISATLNFSACDDYGVYMNGTVYLTMSGNFCAPTALSVRYVNMTLNDGDFSATLSDFSISYSSMIWSGDEVVSATIVLNGSIDSTSGTESFDMSFRNYTMTMAETGPTTTEITVNGSITGSCIDGWVTFETTETIVVVDGLDCPTGGTVRMAGEGEAITYFNPDGSVDIEIVGGTTTHYDSCNDLPDECV